MKNANIKEGYMNNYSNIYSSNRYFDFFDYDP
jgi:hypothetical protein